MTYLYCDLETFSPTPIKAGTHRYAEEAEVMLWPYAFDDGAPRVWDRTDGSAMPSDLADGLADPDVMTVWHNGGMFDLVVLRHAMGITLPLTRVEDTMVQALAHSLPGALGQLCDILGVSSDKAKDKAGKALIQRFCKPTGKNIKLRRHTRATHPEQWAQFVEYARLDITSMREVHKKLPRWNLTIFERELWYLDQAINNRGMPIDMALVTGAIRAIDTEQARLRDRASALTDGYIVAATQRDRLLEYVLGEYGYGFADLRGVTVERFLKTADLEPELRDLLEVRLQASTTSTSKYKALLGAVSSDGRLRGTKQFCGANRTARWAGRLFQPDNLPRPTMPHDEIAIGIKAITEGCEAMLFENVMALTSNTIRGSIAAPPGKKFVISDLSNIEGRMLAWLAGEQWKLQAFRDFDNGEGPDLYKLAYAKSFRIDPSEVDKTQRQVGKTLELSMGYAGGISAFVTFAAAYNTDLEALANVAWPHLPKETIEEAESFLDWLATRKDAKQFPMSRKAQVVCECFKRLWRAAHPATVRWWKELETAARDAITSPGTTIRGTNFKARRDGAWLRMQLPSGRYLCYPHPQVADDGQLSYMGVNQFTRKWCRTKTYSGKLAENLTQAASRDVLAEGLLRADRAGYPSILHVHDENVTETPDTTDYTADALSSLLATQPLWAPDLPLAAAGFEAYRYGKE